MDAARPLSRSQASKPCRQDEHEPVEHGLDVELCGHLEETGHGNREHQLRDQGAPHVDPPRPDRS